MTAAVQTIAYHSDPDPYNHTINDTFDKINQNYLYEQIKATTAFAGQLLEPIAFEHKIRHPLVWGYKY